MSKYLKDLNSAQCEVVTDTENPILVLAGAGSGKTRCIIHRVAYLIKEKGVPPWKILVVTFTNKAARELRERLEDLLNINASSLWVGTFHSICLRILRFEKDYHPFGANFSIYGDDEQRSILRKIYKEKGYHQKNYPFNRVLSRISRYKNRLILPEEISEEEKNLGVYQSRVIDIYHQYQQTLLMNKAMDFDDILLYTARLLQSHEMLRNKYRETFQYIMIDEYQDTNMAQFEIIHQLGQEHQRVCVVGDDDQAIYSFRGASLRNILEFEKDYDSVRKIRLEQNYRSTNSILRLANIVIKENRQRHPKALFSELGEGLKPVLNVYADANLEADMIAKDIYDMWQDGLALSEMVVLYRTNAQSRLFEIALTQKKVPYTIVGSQNFYQRKEVKDLIAYLNVMINPADNESLLRIINEPARGIGQTTQGRLLSHAADAHISMYQAVQNVDFVPKINAGLRAKVSDFAEMMKGYASRVGKDPVVELVKELVEELGFIGQYRKSGDPKEIARAENLIEFVASVSEFADRFSEENNRAALLADFMPHVALQTDLDRAEGQQESIMLMTLHNAKGLEFDTVYIAGMENELLPHRMSMETREEIEEERRLFYVGITRAKRRLVLSLAQTRRLYDAFMVTRPSLFLRGLDTSVLEAQTPVPQRPQSTYRKPRTKVRDSQKHYKIGQKVWHDEYHDGVILAVNGMDEDAIVTVSFKSGKLIKVVGRFLKTEF